MNGKDLRQAFLDRESIVGVEFQHNDYVRVIDGPYRGINGSLVSLEAIESEPIFLVELEEGGDVEIRQSQLDFINHDS
jgi:transcription antitermination factor NusG